MTDDEITAFVRSLVGLSEEEQEKACFNLFDKVGKEAAEVNEMLFYKVLEEGAEKFSLLLYEQQPDFYALWCMDKRNKERAARGLPPICAK